MDYSIQVSPNPAALAQSAAAEFTRLAQSAIEHRGRFSVALAGGSTPEKLYRLLASPPFAGQIDWARVEVYWSDERCVPPDDPQSNYRMARLALLEQVPLPPENIHRLQGELDPRLAAFQYEEWLRSAFATPAATGAESPVASFDLILLGMGEDGHTASLFPHQNAVHEDWRWVVAEQIQKLDTWRLTFTPPLINAAANVIFLVAGEHKAESLKQVLQGPYQPELLPAQVVKPTNGRLLWLVDAAAAALL